MGNVDADIVNIASLDDFEGFGTTRAREYRYRHAGGRGWATAKRPRGTKRRCLEGNGASERDEAGTKGGGADIKVDKIVRIPHRGGDRLSYRIMVHSF